MPVCRSSRISVPPFQRATMDEELADVLASFGVAASRAINFHVVNSPVRAIIPSPRVVNRTIELLFQPVHKLDRLVVAHEIFEPAHDIGFHLMNTFLALKV
ncbi:hypothetical protein SAMN05446935_8413 [Burkholderia sp. YR290]|nr:hypothetical protein SAMN05446935_8413 [Burkholderia sp. YR290]